MRNALLGVGGSEVGWQDHGWEIVRGEETEGRRVPHALLAVEETRDAEADVHHLEAWEDEIFVWESALEAFEGLELGAYSGRRPLRGC